jgi:predicted nuclease of predicted toxin-antitoxin system
VKLLFDQNLSFRLVARLAIISKDSDFHQLSFLFGHPPKVVWVRLANCSTAEIERLVRARLPEIQSFLEDREAAFLALS